MCLLLLWLALLSWLDRLWNGPLGATDPLNTEAP